MHGYFEPVRSRNESYPAWLGGEGQAVGCESPWREGLVNLTQHGTQLTTGPKQRLVKWSAPLGEVQLELVLKL